MKNVVSVLVVGMMGCMVWSENPTHHYDLFIDDTTLTPHQSDLIIQAATAWQKQTGNYLTFSGISDPSGPDTISVYGLTPQAMSSDFGSGFDHGMHNQ